MRARVHLKRDRVGDLVLLALDLSKDGKRLVNRRKARLQTRDYAGEIQSAKRTELIVRKRTGWP